MTQTITLAQLRKILVELRATVDDEPDNFRRAYRFALKEVEAKVKELLPKKEPVNG